MIDGAHHGVRAGPDLAWETWVGHKQKQSSPALGTTYRTWNRWLARPEPPQGGDSISVMVAIQQTVGAGLL